MNQVPVPVQQNTPNRNQGNIQQIITPQPNQIAYSIIRGQKYQPQQNQGQVQQQGIEHNQEPNPPLTNQKINIAKRQNFTEFNGIAYQEFNRKCLILNHTEASLLEFCSNRRCKQPSRFLCEFCLKDELHKSDIQYRSSLILKQNQVFERIKQNHNNLVQIYKTNTTAVDNILLKFKTQIETVYSNIANFAKSAQFNESQYRIKQLNEILNGTQNISSIEANNLYKLIDEQPENYLCEEFGEMVRGFTQIKKDFDKLQEISLEIPNVIKDLMKLKNMEQSQQIRRSDQIIAEAKTSIQSGQIEQAIEMLIDHLEQDRSQEGESEIRNTLGYGYYKQKSYDKAICQFEAALEASKLESNNYQYYYYIGKCQFKSYLTYCSEIQMDTKSVICAYFLQNFYESIQLNPKFNGAYIQIYKIFGNLKQSDNQVEILLQGLQNNQRDYKLTLLMGQQKFLQNQYQQALIYINEALKIKEFDLKITQPEYMFKKFNPIFTKGVILCELGNYNESLQIMSQIIKYNIYNDEAHYIKSVCLYNLKEYDQALNILQFLVRKRGNKEDDRYDNLIVLILAIPQYYRKR